MNTRSYLEKQKVESIRTKIGFLGASCLPYLLELNTAYLDCIKSSSQIASDIINLAKNVKLLHTMVYIYLGKLAKARQFCFALEPLSLTV